MRKKGVVVYSKYSHLFGGVKDEHAKKVLSSMMEYAENGIWIAPLKGKQPLLREFQKTRHEMADIVSDGATWVGLAEQREAHFNVGLVTGQLNGLVGLDIEEENAPWNLDRQYLLGDQTCTASGGGGAHYYFDHTARLKSGIVSMKVRGRDTMIEIKDRGYQLVIPPSIHPDTGESYVFVGPEGMGDGGDFTVDPIAAIKAKQQMPPQLLEDLLSAPKESKRRGRGKPLAHNPAPLVDVGLNANERIKILRKTIGKHVRPGELSAVLSAARRHHPVPEGYRNTDLTRFAGQIAGHFQRLPRSFFNVLYGYSLVFHVPPLGSVQVAVTARSILRMPQRDLSLESKIIRTLKDHGPIAARHLTILLGRRASVIGETLRELKRLGRVVRHGAGRNSQIIYVRSG